MGAIRDKMKADLELRAFAPSTRKEYLRRARNFVAHFGRPPTELGEREVREFLLYLLNGRRRARRRLVLPDHRVDTAPLEPYQSLVVNVAQIGKKQRALADRSVVEFRAVVVTLRRQMLLDGQPVLERDDRVELEGRRPFRAC